MDTVHAHTHALKERTQQNQRPGSVLSNSKVLVKHRLLVVSTLLYQGQKDATKVKLASYMAPATESHDLKSVTHGVRVTQLAVFTESEITCSPQREVHKMA